ncbi:3-deoxy-7-phosphoheptulonate synthase [Acidaminococcus massiliensis]|jgi:3-deoxy-7-phosphoheptulonate synthase|uniref:3-deoxy-7-phosphoheptulonate synthase n=1 Tax=Acidaminococcus massiliensis TaxID=1852375 RepID=UPI00266CBBC6|nr:3-deoxy-7-phosphoheptulonate synthase [Acidaminococcus massiliensis]
MIIVMKKGAPKEASEKLRKSLEQRGFTIHDSIGENQEVLGIVGDTSILDPEDFMVNEWVDKAMRVQEPFKRANRMFHPDDSIIDVSGVKVGGKKLVVIAGPCSVEGQQQMDTIAASVKQSGAAMLRGGAFKPRTSPYSFQGLGDKGLDMIRQAGNANHLPIVTEIMSADKIDEFVEKVDLIQVGARNMQNFTLLKELGKLKKPILLKRGLSATIEEWLMSAEYIMSEGNENVILCERGIRTFETYTRNTLDLSAVQAVKRLSHLPVIVDPSHATGKAWMVPTMSKAAIAAGADGLIIETHNDPQHAWCDGAQSLSLPDFDKLMQDLRILAPAVGREL